MANKKVLIIGAGPVGCAFAHKLLYKKVGDHEELRNGIEVHMIDAGAMLSPRPGEHLKNSYQYQRNVNLFTGVIRGHLQPLSTPVDRRPVVTLDPGSARFDKPFVHNSQNPDQNPDCNLSGSAATYAVGGMATHWTCACPRLHNNERGTLKDNPFEDDLVWKDLYDEAEKLLAVTKSQTPEGHLNPDYPFQDSVRHQNAVAVLTDTYPDVGVKGLPLACKKAEGTPNRINWNGSDTVLGDLIKDPPTRYRHENGKFEGYSYCEGRLIIYPLHQCKRLKLRTLNTPGAENEWTIEGVEIKNLVTQQLDTFTADSYIVAVGAVLTPQLLFNSGISPLPDEDWKPEENSLQEQGVAHKLSLPVGLFLAEQPMAFSQAVLSQDIIDEMKRNAPSLYGEYIPPKLEADPLEQIIPSSALEPQAYIPYSPERPWHCQIHRDAFSYGELAPNVDGRLIIDLRWFGQTWQDPRNRVTFRSNINDAFGMPQPTFTYSLRDFPLKRNGNDFEEDFEALNQELKQPDTNIPSRPTYLDVLGAFTKIEEFEDLKKNKDSRANPINAEKSIPDLRRVRAMQHEMMEDMLKAAAAFGGFLPGSEPQFMAPGLALHIHGTTRMGKDPRRSVVNTDSKVHKVDNLYLGGNGILPVGEAANPTLTSVAFAVRSSAKILASLNLTAELEEAGTKH